VESALLENLLSGGASGSQLVGGLVIATLYLVIGLLAHQAADQVEVHGAAYFAAPAHAWQTELTGVAVFLVCAVGGLFSRPAVAVGYAAHGIWDLSHCLSGTSLAGLSLTEVPLGYGIFCSTLDFVVAGYLAMGATAWHEPGRFTPYFWRHRP